MAAGNPAVWNLHERPADAVEQARAYRDALEPFVQPIDPKAMAMLLKRLSLHYHMPQMTDREREMFWLDYRKDIGHLGLDLVAEACETWRRNPANKWFPRPCELLEIVRSKHDWRVRYRGNLDRWLASQGTAP